LVVVLGSLLGTWVTTSTAQEPTLATPQAFITDSVGVIDAPTRRQLEALLTELQAKTGAEVAIVVVRSTQPLSAFDYAMKIAEQWRPGSRQRDNGVVFLVAIDDRQMYILTGYGVEGVLPDGRVGEIRDRLVRPQFRGGNYSAGIRDATREIASILAADAGVELTGVPPPRTSPNVELSGRQMLLLVLATLLVLYLITRGGAATLLIGGPRRYGPGPGIPGSFGGGFGGGGFGGHGGGFGGFGGGGFGGGGAGGSW